MSSADERKAAREKAAADRKAAREKAAQERAAKRGAAANSAKTDVNTTQRSTARERLSSGREGGRSSSDRGRSGAGRGSARAKASEAESATKGSSVHKERRRSQRSRQQDESNKAEAYRSTMQELDAKTGRGTLELKADTAQSSTSKATSVAERMKSLIDAERLEQIAERRRSSSEHAKFVQRHSARLEQQDSIRRPYEEMRPFQLRKMCAARQIVVDRNATKAHLIEQLMHHGAQQEVSARPDRLQIDLQAAKSDGLAIGGGLVAGNSEVAIEGKMFGEMQTQLTCDRYGNRPSWAPRTRPRRLDDDPAWLREAGYLEQNVTGEITLQSDNFELTAGRTGTSERKKFQRDFQAELVCILRRCITI